MKKKKVLFVASLGGHLSELFQFKSLFKDYNYLLVTEKNPTTINLKEEYNVKFFNYCNKSNWFKYLMINIINGFRSVGTFIKFRPDVIVTTGANTCVPLCYLCWLFRKKVIYIETLAKRYGKSTSGKLVYPIADVFIVQWEEMLKVYPKAVYWGGLY